MRARPYHRKSIRSIVAMAFFLSAASLTAAPASAQEHDEQLWLQVNTNVPLGDGFRVTLEQIGRVGDRADGLFQTEFGAILGYKVADNVEVGFGYRKVGMHGPGHGRAEDRIRQHVIATFGPVTTRFRVDERFHPEGNEVGFRVRPLVRYNHKLGANGWALFASHESFILPNTTKWGQRSGYERMRNIAGVVVPISGQVSADVGYLNQYRLARAGRRAQMDHALTVQLTINLGGGSHAKADD